MVCFVAQQAAEKARKAFLYARGEREVIGRSIERLLARAVAYDAELAALESELPLLDAHYIPTRYPNGLVESIPARVYTRSAAEEALRLARAAIAAVERAAFPPGPP
jgi:HEPN domain-containing protein